MKRIIDDLNHDEEIIKISLWKRLFILILYYLRLGLHDLYKMLLHLIEKDKRKVLFHNIHAFLILFYKKSTQEGVLKEAATLTYITLLGFMPFLVLVVFLLPKITALASQSKLNLRLYQNFMPVSTSEVGNLVTQLFSQKATFSFFTLVIAIITSYSLFKIIRDTFDRILVMEYHPPKDLVSQLLKFFGTIIFGFIIILLLFSSSSLPIVSSLLYFPLFKKWLIFVLPFVLQFLALVFLYMMLPSIKVKRSALYRGAFWTTLIWVIVKSCFDYYVYNLTNIEVVYGVLKTLPIFLFWIYVNWVIILSGMVLVTILEHREKALDEVTEKHYVRVTLEMYTNKKMDKQVDAVGQHG